MINHPLTKDKFWIKYSFDNKLVPPKEIAVRLYTEDDAFSAVQGLKSNLYGGKDWNELREADYVYVLSLIDKWFPVFSKDSLSLTGGVLSEVHADSSAVPTEEIATSVHTGEMERPSMGADRKAINSNSLLTRELEQQTSSSVNSPSVEEKDGTYIILCDLCYTKGLESCPHNYGYKIKVLSRGAEL